MLRAIRLRVGIPAAADQQHDVHLNGSYVDAKYLQGSFDQCYPGQTLALGCVNGLQSLDGQVLPDAPKLSFTARAHQEVPLSDGYNGYIDLSYFHRSSAQLGPTAGAPLTYQKAYGRFDATLGVRGQLGSGQFNLRGYVRNLFETNYATTIVNAAQLGTFLWQYVPYESGRRVFGIALDWEM